VELVSVKGWRIPATPPYVSSYLFLLPVYDAPSSVERGEKIGEEERRGRREVRGGEGGRWFVNIHYVCAEKGEVVGEKKWKRNETVGIPAWKNVRDARHARIYSHESACKEDRNEKGNRKKCAAEPM